jgi:hypothetical protein
MEIDMYITVVEFVSFDSIVIGGCITLEEQENIRKLKRKACSTDEYAGYSPSCQTAYKQIEKIRDRYPKVTAEFI